jgi:hypothetical protein
MDDAVPFASREYFVFAAVLTLARGMDCLSTWVATPHLVLEGNPIAKWLGWKWGGLVNLVLVFSVAHWPLATVIVSTASLLVAARNFQSAWLMRSMGEEAYRDWYSRRLGQAGLPLYLACLAGNTGLTAVVAGALVYYSRTEDYILIIPYGIGVGMLAYVVAVVFYTLLGLWRGRWAAARPGSSVPPEP